MKQYVNVLISLAVFLLPLKLIRESIEDVSLESLKLRPMINQTGTCIYNAAKVVAKCVHPLSKNEFSITDTLRFPELLKNSSNDESYEDISYDVESLFISIPV